MRKQTRIFLVVIATVLVAATSLLLLVNNSLVTPYYIYRQRQTLREVGQVLTQDATVLSGYIPNAERDKGVIIVAVPNTNEIDQLNEELRDALLAKGLGLSRYWLWQEDYNSTIANGGQQRAYSQGSLGYSLLMQYVVHKDTFFAVAMVIPNISSQMGIANVLLATLMTGTALLLMLLIWWMSHSLQKTQLQLTHKNEQMTQLLCNVSHDLKTPISLIKAYSTGIRDGLDDGSFLPTIMEQNERMEELTQRLLALARCDTARPILQSVDVGVVLQQMLAERVPLLEQGQLTVAPHIQQGLVVDCDPQALRTICDNLLSNAAKYSVGSPITVELQQQGSGCIIRISNPTDLPDDTNTESLWEPFCVAEASRNSSLCGSGLGLALVRAAAQSMQATCSCTVSEGQFTVTTHIATTPRSYSGYI